MIDLKGRRIDETEEFDYHATPCPLRPGEYGLDEHKHWWLRAPSGALGSIDPALHTVTEHEDGSITVVPSLSFERTWVRPETCPPLNFGYSPSTWWHGWLQHGVWREA